MRLGLKKKSAENTKLKNIYLSSINILWDKVTCYFFAYDRLWPLKLCRTLQCIYLDRIWWCMTFTVKAIKQWRSLKSKCIYTHLHLCQSRNKMEQYICLRYFLVWYGVCKEYVWDANITQKVKSYEKGSRSYSNRLWMPNVIQDEFKVVEALGIVKLVQIRKTWKHETWPVGRYWP